MKRLTAIFIILILISVTGCSSKKAYESEKTSESVQVDNTKETVKVTEIDEQSAKQLVSERLDTTKYSVTKENEISVDDKNYYVFAIQEGENTLSMGVAVEKISGELFAYKEDKTIAPYSEFTLYDENEDMQVSWEGTYKSQIATLELFPLDSNSFEFSVQSEDQNDTISGVAQADGNTAIYAGESGYQITFVNEGNNITVKESQKTEGQTAFEGTYTK